MEQLGTTLNMLICNKHKFIFVKTKKTAGSTVEKVLVDHVCDHSIDVCTGSKIDDTPRLNIGPKLPNQPDGHRPWYMIKQMVGDQVWNDYTTFTVERNPWAKVVSEFYWKTEREPHLKVYSNDEDNFKHFVHNVLGSWYALPQDWQLYADNDQLMVDHVIQYNHLAEQMVSLMDTVGVTITTDMITGTRMKSGYRKKHYSELYSSQDLIDKVAGLFHREINHFQYKFGD